MSFTTIPFLFTFLPIVTLLYVKCPKVYQNHVLLICSILFYAWGEPTYVTFLLLMLVVNYKMVTCIAKSTDKKRKRHLIETIAINLFLLGYFKYYGSILTTLFQDIQPNIQNMGMPLGISFFTFSILSYVIDVYRKTTTQATTFSSFALYVCFFPKLLMGPIEPYHVFAKKIFTHHMSMELFDQGAKYFIIGMAQKVILADTFARCYIDVQNIPMSFLSGWLMALAFSFQIYFDFSGYSHMALGLANMFGYSLMKNFNFPYMADSITSFWRRWHISLSQFFRDYIYIALGGNRVSKARMIMNLAIVWVLTGVWHGASMNFMIWGAYYGILLILEKYVWGNYFQKLPRWLRWLFTFIIINIGWVIFAHTDMQSALLQLRAMFMIHTSFASESAYFYLLNYGVFIVLGIVLCLPFVYLKMAILKKKKPSYTVFSFAIYGVLCILSIFYIASSNFQSFLYFQF